MNWKLRLNRLYIRGHAQPILNKTLSVNDTVFGGETTSFAACIRWSIGAAMEISRATYRSLLGKIGQEDVLHTREVKKDVRS